MKLTSDVKQLIQRSQWEVITIEPSKMIARKQRKTLQVFTPRMTLYLGLHAASLAYNNIIALLYSWQIHLLIKKRFAYYIICSEKKDKFHWNIWIRSLFLSHTTIWSFLRTATENGLLNSPNLLPFVPNFPTNFPSSSKTCIIRLFLSQTNRCFDWVTDRNVDD